MISLLIVVVIAYALPNSIMKPVKAMIADKCRFLPWFPPEYFNL
jgi:hypothetical protein